MNREIPGGDLATLRKFRSVAAFVLLVVTPLVQIGVTRLLPMALGTTLVILVVGHLVTKSGQLRLSYLTESFKNSDWSAPKRALFALYAIYVAWTVVSLLWSPVPQKGVRDIVVLIAFAPVVAFLSHDFSQVPVIRFARFLRWGISLSAVLLISELLRFTNLHQLLAEDEHLYDLNRNAVLLSLVIWILPLFWQSRSKNVYYDAIPLVLTMIVQYLSESQSAQVAFILAALAGVAIRLWRPVLHLAFGSMIIAMLVFPQVVPHLDRFVAGSTNPIVVNGNAAHRVSIWQGFKEHIDQSPLIGWGVRADRHLALNDERSFKRFAAVTRHPHNFILEIWVTLGAVGAALAAMVVGSFWWVVSAMPRRRSIIATQLTVGSYAYAATGSAMMQGWWLATLLLVIAVFCTATRSGTTPIAQSS